MTGERVQRTHIRVWKLGQQFSDAPTEFEHLPVIEKSNRTPWASFCRFQGLRKILIIRIAAGRLDNRACGVLHLERAQKQAPASRSDSGQFASGRVAYEEKQRAFGWLLQGFQKCVGTLAL